MKSKKIIKEIIIYASIIIFIVLLRSFVITPVRVNGDSMETTLHDKEIMLLNKIDYRFNKIERFDIVVIKYNDEYLIKRVIGLPGERLYYKDNVLYINDEAVMESYLTQPTADFDIEDFGSKTIPKNKYVVLGDNRSVSLDSRFIGFVDKKDIAGSASLVLYPFKSFGFKK